MKVRLRYLIYSLSVVLFFVGSFYLVKAHPEVQFAFYLPGIAMVMFAIISDDLFTKPNHLRHLRGK